MDKKLMDKIDDVLKEEAQEIMKSKEKISKKLDKMNQIINITKIIECYDELEPVFKEYFEKKHQKEKWGEDR